ncbi:MAG: glycosyltransferase [Halobacteriales archaeon]
MPGARGDSGSGLRDGDARRSGGEARPPGRYRLRDPVRQEGGLLVSTRPLVVTRVNDAATRVVDELSTDTYREPATVAEAAGVDPSAAATVLAGLDDRGFLEWQPARDPTYRPPVSVVVTVRDDADHLRACLDALAALEYPEYEVVVVDDGSTDTTRSVAEAHDCPTELVEVGRPDAPIGIGASRNRGVDVAGHEVVAFTDADCRPRSDWLSALVPALATHDVIGGRVRPAGDGGASAYEAVNSSLDMGSRAGTVRRGGETPYLPTANLLARRSTFEAVGFPERSVAEDVKFCWDALERGFDVVYDPRGVVEHDYGDGKRFCQRRRSYGASEALIATEFTPVGSVPIPVLPVVVTLLAVWLVASLSVDPGPTLTRLGAGLTAVVAGNVWWTRRRSDGLIRITEALRSLGRRALSSTYAVTREVTRYYSLPVVVVASVAATVVPVAATVVPVAATVVPVAGVVTVSLVAFAVVVPALVEYLVYRPSIGPLGYAWYYLRDHLAYQLGTYRGAITYGTLSHLTPTGRFRLQLGL